MRGRKEGALALGRIAEMEKEMATAGGKKEKGESTSPCRAKPRNRMRTGGRSRSWDIGFERGEVVRQRWVVAEELSEFVRRRAVGA